MGEVFVHLCANSKDRRTQCDRYDINFGSHPIVNSKIADRWQDQAVKKAHSVALHLTARAEHDSARRLHQPSTTLRDIPFLTTSDAVSLQCELRFPNVRNRQRIIRYPPSGSCSSTLAACIIRSSKSGPRCILRSGKRARYNSYNLTQSSLHTY